MALSPQYPKNVVKNRNAVLKLQKRSPLLKEIHREKFKCRLKNNRGEFMNRLRHMTREEVQQSIIREDKIIWNEINNSYIGNDVLMTEPETTDEYFVVDSELEGWLMQMYEEYMAEDEDMVNSFLDNNYPKELLCMICESGKLVYTVDGSAITCNNGNCDTTLSATMKIEELVDHLQEIMENHNALCDSQLKHSVYKQRWLGLICTQCNFQKIVR